MKARTLRVEALEDRSVPSATLASQDLAAGAPVQEAVSVMAVAAVKVVDIKDGTNDSGPPRKLAVNHNETLVRDRRGRKRRRR